MRTLTQREQRTIRYGGIGIGIYLVLFLGFHLWKIFERRRSDYQDLVVQARNLKSEIEPYQTKVLVVDKLMEEFHLDPARLSEASVVAQASAAIQNEANADGIKLGTIRESPAQSSSRELATMHLEGTGPIPAVLSLLDRLKRLGYPLMIDSVQLTSDPMRPGQIKLDLTIAILDFEQWKTPEATAFLHRTLFARFQRGTSAETDEKRPASLLALGFSPAQQGSNRLKGNLFLRQTAGCKTGKKETYA